MKRAHSIALEALSTQILKGIQAESLALYAEYEKLCDTGERVAPDGAHEQVDLFAAVRAAPSGD